MNQDARMEQARKILSGLVSASMNDRTEALVHQNELIVVIDKTVLYIVPLLNIEPNFYQDIGFRYDILIKECGDNLSCYISDYEVVDRVISIYNSYMFIIHNNIPIISEEDLRSNPQFESLLGLKASDGLLYFNIYSNFITDNSNTQLIKIPVFTGFPSINAKDKIGVTVFNEINTFIINFNIFKKKFNRNLNMIYRILKL